MKKNIKVFTFLLVLVLFAVSLTACQPSGVERCGIFVANKLQDSEITQYVFCLSKNSTNGAKIIANINKAIAESDLDKIIFTYMQDEPRRRVDGLGLYDLTDNDGEEIVIYTTVFEPYQFSGAYGNGVDGIDVCVMSQMAEDLNARLVFNDLPYLTAYDNVKKNNNVIGAMGIALNEQVEQDMLVSEVYSKGYQQIVSDKNEGYTKLSQLKGLKIGVLTGRTGASIVKQAIESGVLKGSGAEVVEYSTDAEASTMLTHEMCDVLVIDELPAQLIALRSAK